MPQPSILPSQIDDPDLRAFYRRASQSDRRGLTISAADTADVAHANDLQALGLGKVTSWGDDSDKMTFTPVIVHSTYFAADRYTGTRGPSADPGEADWAGRVLLDVEIHLPEADASGNDVLLATLHGATVDQRGSKRSEPWTMWSLAVRHATATDREHDRAYVAEVEVRDLTLTSVTGSRTEAYGILAAVAAYPFGADILQQGSTRSDVEPGEVCDDATYCTRKDSPLHDGEGFHPVMGFSAPAHEARGLRGTPVRVTMRPMAVE